MQKKQHIQEPSQNDVVSKLLPTLPTDIIITILSKLPVKSLGKFKYVSQQWLQLITQSHYFRTLHRDFCLNNPSIILLNKIPALRQTRIDLCCLNFDGSSKNVEFSLVLNDKEANIELLPSKWDVLCFVSTRGFYVCNPSNESMVKLPRASCCTINVAMGYDKARNEYVFVHLFNRSLGYIYDIGCEVLRLGDGKECEWKVVNVRCPFPVRGWGVLVGNVFYWMINEEYLRVEDKDILSFDLGKEEFGTVAPPEEYFELSGEWSLVELGGSLCLVDNLSRAQVIDVWVMKDCVAHSWVREYRIDVNGYGWDAEFLSSVVPLEYRNGEIWMDVQESLDCYDVDKKQIKRMDHLIAGEWNWLRIYTESFFSFAEAV